MRMNEQVKWVKETAVRRTDTAEQRQSCVHMHSYRKDDVREGRRNNWENMRRLLCFCQGDAHA